MTEQLKPCPFCGGSDIDQYQIGNEWTKKRAYEIKCKTFGCCTTRKVGVISQSLEWAREKCIEKWNKRHADTEIAALKADLQNAEARVKSATKLATEQCDEVVALRAENERLRAGIDRAKQIINAENIHPLSIHFANSVMLALTPPQPTEEEKEKDVPNRVNIACSRGGCIRPVVGNYGGIGYCEYHLTKLENEFDEEYR